MLSIPELSQSLGARPGDMADLMQVSRRTIFYLKDGNLNIPPDKLDFYHRIQKAVAHSISDTGNGNSAIPSAVFNEEEIIASLVAQKELELARVQKEIEHLENNLQRELSCRELLGRVKISSENADEIEQFEKWIQRMVHRSTIRLSKFNYRKLMRHRVRMAGLQAEITALKNGSSMVGG